VHMQGFWSAMRKLPVPYHPGHAGCFAAICDGPAVAGLLNRWVAALGKRTAAGFGWVDAWECAETDMTAEDILRMRPVPVALAEQWGMTEGRVRNVTWRAPYWSKNAEPCLCPK